MDSLQGRHALVCGGSAGIGRASAEAFARLGVRVTLLARRESLLQAVVSDLESVGNVDVDWRVADLDDRVGLGEVMARLLEDRGPIEILVNNTGGPPAGRLLDATPEDLTVAFGRHVLASLALVKAVLPGMEKAGWGRIVNVISTSVREPIPSLGVSNVIRGAMASWAKTLSRELPPGITINNVLPGYTDTERLQELGTSLADARSVPVADVQEGWIGEVPEGRLGRPEEVAEAVVYLACAAYVRGINLVVDGGRLRSI